MENNFLSLFQFLFIEKQTSVNVLGYGYLEIDYSNVCYVLVINVTSAVFKSFNIVQVSKKNSAIKYSDLARAIITV